jgi:AhpD family alkylhydroperoxidase
MSNRIEYAKASPAGYKAFGGVHVYLQNCGLPKELIDLVYLRVSQINGCAYCIDMHSRDLLKLGVMVDKLVLVPVWHEAGEVFSTRERTALAWAETVTRVAETGVATVHAPFPAPAMLSNFRRSKAMPPAVFDALVNIAGLPLQDRITGGISGQTTLNKARDRS